MGVLDIVHTRRSERKDPKAKYTYRDPSNSLPLVNLIVAGVPHPLGVILSLHDFGFLQMMRSLKNR